MTTVEPPRYCDHCGAPLKQLRGNACPFCDMPVAGTAPPSISNTVDVVLQNAGKKKIAIIKLVREATGWGLKEAKDAVDMAPVALFRDVDPTWGSQMTDALTREGGSAFTQPHQPG